MTRKHEREGFCSVCGAAAPTVGSACVVPRLASAAYRMEQGARRRDILERARSLTVDVEGGSLVVEAAYDAGGAVHMYVDADEARRLHGSDIILTGLTNPRTTDEGER